MRPQDLAKTSEHSQQCAYFMWVNYAAIHGVDAANAWAGVECPLMSYVAEIGLNFIHAIPNGGSRGDSEKSRAVRGAALAAEGVMAGVFDVFIPCPINGFSGCYIEFKRPALKSKKNQEAGLSGDQKEFAEYARKAGYHCAVVYNWREAANVTLMYLSRSQRDIDWQKQEF